VVITSLIKNDKFEMKNKTKQKKQKNPTKTTKDIFFCITATLPPHTHTLKHIKFVYSHYSDSSKPVIGYEANNNMVTDQSGI
jgi:hypothetical protein